MNTTQVLALLAGSLMAPLVTAITPTVQLDGRFEYRTDAESLDILGRQVCFFPSATSARLVPRSPSDQRMVWFCFSNSDYAVKAFQIERHQKAESCGTTGTAAIRITKYTVYSQEGDGNDIAELQSVVDRSLPTPLPCQHE